LVPTTFDLARAVLLLDPSSGGVSSLAVGSWAWPTDSSAGRLTLAEAERMPYWVEKHAERRAWLVVRLGRPQGQHLTLTLVEIGDVEVQVELLRRVLVGPGRRNSRSIELEVFPVPS
jgi:hypothetical protein